MLRLCNQRPAVDAGLTYLTNPQSSTARGNWHDTARPGKLTFAVAEDGPISHDTGRLEMRRGPSLMFVNKRLSLAMCFLT